MDQDVYSKPVVDEVFEQLEARTLQLRGEVTQLQLRLREAGDQLAERRATLQRIELLAQRAVDGYSPHFLREILRESRAHKD